MLKSDADFMQMALDLARGGWGYTSPNPMVGAVLVREGIVVGKGFHQMVGGPHAEVHAIEDAGESAEGATLYVTLEPCNHLGRTPPCTRRVIESGIRRVVVAMEDPNPDVRGGGNAFLRARGIAVEVGVLEDEARILNEIFIKYTTTRQPFVILKCAATLDGRIATRTGDSRWVSGEKSRDFVHSLRHGVDGILVGSGTIRADDPSLTTRLEGRKGLDPTRIILDTRLSIPENARILNLDSESETILVTGEAVSEKKKAAFKDRSVRVLETPLKNGRIDLDLLMTRLGDIGITSLLIEGGSRVISSALHSRIVDKVCFFYAPKILGGDDGIPICSGPGPDFMRQCIPIRNTEVHRFGEDVMIQGYIDKTETG